jgi:transmembrane sensor
MAPRDLDKLIEKYLQGKCSQQESEFIDAWYASLGKNAGSEITSVSTDEHLALAEGRILANLQKYTSAASNRKTREIRMTSSRWKFTAIAASLLICVAASYIFYDIHRPAPVAANQHRRALTTVENSDVQAKRVILPDGSIVQLSANSRIRFANENISSTRELYLDGEAYFDVAHDSRRPFYVYAGDIVTKVLGTSFIVRTSGKDKKVTVTVKTGKVTVYSKNAAHKKTVLTRNQEAVYDQDQDVVATRPMVESVAKVFVEKGLNEMRFEETPIPEVLEKLKKTYGIDIIYDEKTLSGCVLTSTFVEEGFYDRIDVICTAIGATYRIVGGQTLIKSDGCKFKPE